MENIMKLIDRVGLKYGRLLVVSRAGNKSEKDTNARWNCRCECGNTSVTYGQDLQREKVKSCGCLNAERILKHGMSYTNVHAVWRVMRDRCANPNNPAYKNYGGRGIRVCERWDSFENFLADMGSRPDGYSIDRIDNNGNYDPCNCRWATTKQQMNNQRRNRVIDLNGEKKTIAQWAEKLDISWYCIRDRIDRYGWTIERALTTPKMHN
jgi:hypothetical protein